MDPLDHVNHPAHVGFVGVSVWQLAEYLRASNVPVTLEAILVALTVTLAWLPVARGPLVQFMKERRARRETQSAGGAV